MSIMKNIYAAIIILMMTGCFTESKFNKQFDKAVAKFPTAAAQKTRAAFPCITVSFDSSRFLQSIDELQQIIYSNSIDFANKEKRYQEIHDSLIGAVRVDSNCIEEIESCYSYGASMQARAEKSEKLVGLLKNQIANIKPVIQKIEDSAKINIAMSETAAAISKTAEMKDTAMKYKLLYEVDHRWRVAEERKQKGAIVLYIPIRTIILFLIIVALAILVRSKWKAISSFLSKPKI